jgi:hypothetical protein
MTRYVTALLVLAEAENLGDLINVIHAQHKRSFYLIVDQFNVLDVDVHNKNPEAKYLYM